VAELQQDGLEEFPVPSNFPQSHEDQDVHYQYINFSNGTQAAEGSWPSGPTPDGKARPPVSPRRWRTPRCRRRPTGLRFYGTTELPNTMEKIAGRYRTPSSC
jgi:Mn-containing catalase